MIQVMHLSRKFKDLLAVDDMSFELQKGEVLGFLGPNGAGKSTCMKMISGFLTPNAGSVLIFGYDIEKEPVEAKEKIGYLPEGAPCYGEMTPLQFLNFIADIRKIDLALKPKRISEVIQQLCLEGVIHQSIDTLSKGFKRRVGLAQAILHDPDVLILDEPTDGLDPNQKKEVRELIKRLAKSKIIIVSTHILEEVQAVCTRAMIVDKGRIVFDGTPDALLKRSRYHQAVTLDLLVPHDIKAPLMRISGVKEVECNGAGKQYTIIPQPGSVIFPSVQTLIQAQKWPILQLQVEAGRLDEVFESLTVKERV